MTTAVKYKIDEGDLKGAVKDGHIKIMVGYWTDGVMRMQIFKKYTGVAAVTRDIMTPIIH